MIKTPDFFIVGAPKCGTTAMNEYLDQHPDIYMSPVKEPEFFGSDHQMINRFVQTKDEYLALFSQAKNQKRIGDASVWYLLSKRAAAEIKAFCPHGRIIIMLRNPVDMLYSLHGDLLYVGYEDIEDFETAIETMEVRKSGNYIPGAVNVLQGITYREVVNFAEQTQRYFDIFGRENVHVIIFDDLKTHPEKVYKETLHFLDVSDDFQTKFEVINPRKMVRSKALQKLTKQFWLSPAFKQFNSLMPNWIEKGLFEVFRFIRIHNAVYGGYRPPMDSILRKRLQAEFAPGVEQLSQLLNRDLTYWSIN